MNPSRSLIYTASVSSIVNLVNKFCKGNATGMVWGPLFAVGSSYSLAKVYKSEGYPLYSAISAGAVFGGCGGIRALYSFAAVQKSELRPETPRPSLLTEEGLWLPRISSILIGATIGAAVATYSYIKNPGPPRIIP